ncbi:MAG TPA: sulfurtransferase TusA family protein [Actinomycetota bacterium]|jgi:TusA-related sulfurtransferase|nr:sulfurtransferase TusA family protein [Actinomycetota bacterium]
MTTANVTRSIDARGMPCPGPLMSLIGAIREGTVGDVIEVLSSDEGSKTDIPAWIAKAGHEMVEVAQEPDFARFVIRKAR